MINSNFLINLMKDYNMKQLKELLQCAQDMYTNPNIETMFDISENIKKYNSTTTSYIIKDILPDLVTINPAIGIVKSELSNDQYESLKCIIKSKENNLILAPRQTGKTTLLCYLTMLVCSKIPNTSLLLVGNGYYNLVDMYDIIITNLNLNCVDMIESYNKGKFIKLTNGSKIYFRTCKPDTGRGLSLNYILIDEACYISHSTFYDFLHCIMPCLVNTSPGKLVIISTPNPTTSGPVYDIYSDPEKYNFVFNKWAPKYNNVDYQGSNYNNEILGEFNTP